MDSSQLQGWIALGMYAGFLLMMWWAWKQYQEKLAAEWAETRRIIYATSNMPKGDED